MLEQGARSDDALQACISGCEETQAVVGLDGYEFVCGGEIARPVLLKAEPYQQPSGSTPWKTGEGFMHLDNMYLVRLESVSKGS